MSIKVIPKELDQQELFKNEEALKKEQPKWMESLGEAMTRDSKPKEIEVTESEKENIVYVIQGKIALEAVNDQILVLIDKFKSGYECEECNETGIVQKCDCSKAGTPGFNRFGGTCKKCNGDPSRVEGKQCARCKGSGQKLFIPESTKGLPTSGKIVSAGPNCTMRSVGERVIFGAHTGYFIPFKGNVRLRIMREYEPLCLVYSIAKDVTMDDFMVLEEPIDNKGDL